MGGLKMSKIINFTACFCFVLIIFSCKKNICSVHNIEMKKQNVEIMYGLPAGFYFEYLSKIMTILFPNCDEGVLGGCIVGDPETVKIYVCEQCNKDRDEWKEINWENWKNNYKIRTNN
jgi:hypothetical protein